MESLVGAYLIAWAVVAGYVGWTAATNRGLARRLAELERYLSDRDAAGRSRPNAA